LAERSERNQNPTVKMFSDLKEESNKQVNEDKKLIQDLDKKVSNMEKKFSKEIEVMKNNKVEMLEKKMSIKQIQTTMDRIINRQD
jgi:molybdopterin converting factor small subunit